MYAIIRTGGKQYKVEKGQRLEVERVGAEPGTEIELAPVLVVNDASVLATPAQLAKAKVSARVVDESKGPKIHGFTYKPKSNQRKRWGHRQHYSVVEITAISPG
jgi:large subunit ribosomal protein L21